MESQGGLEAAGVEAVRDEADLVFAPGVALSGGLSLLDFGAMAKEPAERQELSAVFEPQLTTSEL